MSGYLISHGLIFLYVAIEERRFAFNRTLKMLLILGALSYGIYAWHRLLIVDEISAGSPVPNTMAMILLAYGSYLIVERSLLQLKQ